MDTEKIIKSSQEQAVGAWINYLNQVRLDRLTEALSRQSANLAAAMDTLENTFAVIKDEIIIRNRGGDKGMHGFIAEIAECGIGNARREIVGKAPVYEWINDNGSEDLRRGAEYIQQKFVQAGGHLSLQAITKHMQQYPDFLAKGGKYQIPKDHYEKIMVYLNMPEATANKLATSSEEFSLRQWQEVHNFFATNDIDISNLEPSILEYSEVQREAIAATLDKEQGHLRYVNQEQRQAAYQGSKPTLTEGVKIAAVGAAGEGATGFVLAVARKRKSGKKIQNFTEADWIDIAGEAGKGGIKGGVRGASVYLLTNYTATPAMVATSITTAAFGVAEQAHLFRNGSIGEQQFIENAEMLCLDASVSALSSIAGQVFIPVPVIGAVIGNAVGTVLYQIGKDGLSAKENELIEKYLKDLTEFDNAMVADYQHYIEQLNRYYAEYMELLACAFEPDVNKAFAGSVKLAQSMGVPNEDILDSYDKIVSYFME